MLSITEILKLEILLDTVDWKIACSMNIVYLPLVKLTNENMNP